MPKLRLTATAVARLQPPKAGQVEYYDSHLPAFGLRVSYSGAKAWFVMSRVDRKLTRVTLGHYPALSLAEARDKARRAVELAKAGGDPRKLKAEERRRKEKERHDTFERVADLFMTSYVQRAAAEYGSRVSAHTARSGYKGLVLAPYHFSDEAGRQRGPDQD